MAKVDNKKWLLYGFQMFFGSVLILALFLFIDFRQALKTIFSTNPVWLGTAVGWMLVYQWVRAFNLCWLAEDKGELTTRKAFVFNMIGLFYSSLLPSQIGGDVVKGAYLWPNFRSGADAYGVILLQRVLQFSSTFLVACVLAAILLPFGYFMSFALILLGGLIVSLIFDRVLRKKKLSTDYIRSLSQPWRAIAKIYCVFSAYRQRKMKLLKASLFAICISLMALIYFWLVMLSVNPQAMAGQAFFAGAMSLISGVIPLSPGALGISEGAFVVSGAAANIPAEEALAAALLSRVIKTLFGRDSTNIRANTFC